MGTIRKPVSTFRSGTLACIAGAGRLVDRGMAQEVSILDAGLLGGAALQLENEAHRLARRDQRFRQRLARQYAGDSVQTDVKIIPANGRKIPDVLSAAAEECAADLVVMGAYGRARALEFLFGSCTESLMTHSDKPILLLH